MAASGTDPRPSYEPSARPLVARARGGIPSWAIVALVAVFGIILFAVLEARRQQILAPSTRARAIDDESAPPPTAPLFIPPAPAPTPTAPAELTAVPKPTPTSTPAPVKPQLPPQPQLQPAPVTPAPALPAPGNPAPRRAGADTAPVLVVDNTTGDAIGPTNATQGSANAAATRTGSQTDSGNDRARAGMFRNRATTVIEGTLIPAVLESALDSTRPGPARALVTGDIRGFDGSRVLIQRGSRLIGEYKADLQAGQSRALVIWTRLVRPDGATIELASPSADTLGRVGIKGKVNNHFLERFASALLQTSLNVGTGLAARAAGGDSIAVLALPGALNATTAASPLTENNIQRTLRVKQGVSISVFVARDLDFTSVENRQ